jgi:serine phosphatase RsbU (regulator of sigma subunit)
LLDLLTGSHAAPALLLRNIEQNLQQFSGTAHQFDDITILALKRSG